jgi:RING finger protein 121/175
MATATAIATATATATQLIVRATQAAAIQFLAHNFTGQPAHPDYQHPQHHEISIEEIIAREEIFLHRPLTQAERKEVIRRVTYYQEHKGHENQHFEMFLIFFGTLIISQLLITLWKKYHLKSYNTCTLLGLWIIPFIFALRAGSMRFSLIWMLFSIVNGYIVKLAIETPMRSLTPRLVYNWYSKVYDVSYLLAGGGYTVLLLAFFHVPVMFGASMEGEADVFITGLLLMFYGMYFGTLGIVL